MINQQMTKPKQLLCGIASGKVIDLLDLRMEDVSIDDIAHSLAHTIRFAGHLQHPITVARHSIYVAELLPEPLRLAGLLHDAHEAYLGDITRPAKAYIRSEGADIDYLERVWQLQIWQKYGCVPWAMADEERILEADDLQLALEIASYATPGPFRDQGKAELAEHGHSDLPLLPIAPFDPLADRRDFLIHFYWYSKVQEQHALDTLRNRFCSNP